MSQSQVLSDVLSEIKSLEPLPEVAMRVLQLSGEEDVIPRELVAVIHTDAGITAKVLKLCNSVHFGFRREIASLPEAGNMLGVTTLVNLVLTSCASRYFRNYGKGGAGRGRKRWEESVSSALASSLVAGMCNVDKHRAYTAGLLMNVGHLVLDRYLPEKGDQLEQEIQGGSSRLEAEETVVGLSHPEIGSRLAELWGLPDMLIDTIRNHHTPESSDIDPRMAGVAHLGEMFTSSLEMGEGLESLAYELKGNALGICGIDREGFDKIEDMLRAELDKARELVDI